MMTMQVNHTTLMMIMQELLERSFKMAKENEKIRLAARIAGVPLWKVAAAIGISEPTLTRWLRFPIPDEKEQRIMEAINVLSQEVS